MTRVERTSEATLTTLLSHAKVVVTCGAGGVGKTTIAAALGIAAAQLGRTCVVVTIDPAKRLADALGLAALTNEPTRVDLDHHTSNGQLWACMLDTKATFDSIVRREARSAVQAEEILTNSFYRNISSSLSGTQEYMAMEKVHELATSSTFDLVIVDTPPTHHALDFVTAPRRLVRLLDNTVFKLLIVPGRGAMRVVSGAAQTVLRPLTKVIGGDVVSDAVEFFRAFDGMEAGFRSRATETLELLSADATSWLLVTSPQPDPIRAAAQFANQIQQAGISVRGLIVNRAEPTFGELTTVGADAGSFPMDELRALITEHEWAVQAEQRAIDGLVGALVQLRFGLRSELIHLTVAQRADDVHDLVALYEIADRLLGR